MAKENVTATNGGGAPLGAIRARISGGISGSAGRSVTPTYRNGGNAQISENVKIVGAKSPSGKVSLRGGSSQVLNESLRSGAKTSASEAKANARGLKAANGPAKAKAPAANVTERRAAKNVGNKIAKNYPEKPRKDSMSMGAQIVQKEGPSASKTAGKGLGSAQRYQLNSDTMKPIKPKK